MQDHGFGSDDKNGLWLLADERLSRLSVRAEYTAEVVQHSYFYH